MGAGIRKPAQAGRGRRRSRHQPMAEINVTPFVDVMLVLLIIFMVAAPLSVVGVPVELPKSEASALPSDDEEPLTVTLTAQGMTLIQTTEVARDDLIARLTAIAGERDSDRIYFRADGANDWNAVAEVMGALNAAGFTNIGLVTDLPGQGG